MIINRTEPAFAGRAAPWVYKVSMLLVLAVFLPIVVVIWPALMALVGNGTILAMALLTAITLLGGHMLGGPAPLDRATLAVASSVRHPGIAILIANTAFNDKRVTAAVLLYMIVGLLVGIAYKQWFKRTMLVPA